MKIAYISNPCVYDMLRYHPQVAHVLANFENALWRSDGFMDRAFPETIEHLMWHHRFDTYKIHEYVNTVYFPIKTQITHFDSGVCKVFKIGKKMANSEIAYLMHSNGYRPACSAELIMYERDSYETGQLVALGDPARINKTWLVVLCEGQGPTRTVGCTVFETEFWSLGWSFLGIKVK